MINTSGRDKLGRVIKNDMKLLHTEYNIHRGLSLSFMTKFLHRGLQVCTKALMH